MRQLATSILIILCFQATCFAQDKALDDTANTTRISWRAETMTSLSFTGLGSNLVLVGKYGKFEAYLGPRLVVSNTYGLSDNPFGVSAGLRFYPNEGTQRFQGFFNADYQSAYYKNYCPFGNCGDDYNVTTEYSLGYGFRIPFNERLAGTTSIHYAIYRERYTSVLGEDLFVNGYSGLIRVGFQYRFGKQ